MQARSDRKKVFRVALRVLLISPELVVLIGMAVLVYACPFIVEIAGRLPDKWEVLSWLTGGVAALFVWQLRIIHEIRNPGGDKTQLFHDWNGYEKLVVYCKVAVFYGVVSVMLSAAWIGAGVLTHGWAMVCTMTGVVLSCVSFLCCHNAKDDIEHILTKFGPRTSK